MSDAPAPAGVGPSAADAHKDDRAHKIELASLAAWPALTDSDFDGWRLRFANGYTRRSNSITPLAPSRLELGDKIATCERIYRERGLPPIFRLTPFAPEELDGLLAARGYAQGDRVEVRALNLTAPETITSRRTDDAGTERAPRADSVRVEALGLDRWLDIFSTLSGAAEANRSAHRQVLAAVPGTRRLLALIADGRPVSCGMSVFQHGRLGLFDLVTASDCRGRGFGGELLRRALHWGHRAGAEEAYLQVLDTNTGASRLYERAGFDVVYRYHYREPP